MKELKKKVHRQSRYHCMNLQRRICDKVIMNVRSDRAHGRNTENITAICSTNRLSLGNTPYVTQAAPELLSSSAYAIHELIIRVIRPTSSQFCIYADPWTFFWVHRMMRINAIYDVKVTSIEINLDARDDGCSAPFCIACHGCDKPRLVANISCHSVFRIKCATRRGRACVMHIAARPSVRGGESKWWKEQRRM
jgi:hypothetical protein